MLVSTRPLPLTNEKPKSTNMPCTGAPVASVKQTVTPAEVLPGMVDGLAVNVSGEMAGNVDRSASVISSWPTSVVAVPRAQTAMLFPTIETG